MVDWQRVVRELDTEIRSDMGGGQVASYIPALSKVDPTGFGVALATVDGELIEAGDAGIPFPFKASPSSSV